LSGPNLWAFFLHALAYARLWSLHRRVVFANAPLGECPRRLVPIKQFPMEYHQDGKLPMVGNRIYRNAIAVQFQEYRVVAF